MESSAKRRALGRGLGALIPQDSSTVPAAGAAEETGLHIPVSAIHPNPLQPRQKFSESALNELSQSIRDNGILQPLLVRRRGNEFELIAGERRFRAAQKAGLTEVPVTVRDIPDEQLLEIALVENIQRENLNPIEEARAYRRLTDEFGLTQEQVAERVGKDRSTVANSMRLLQLPAEVQDDLESGNLSAGHARALITLVEDREKIALAQDIIRQRLSVREAERHAKRRTVVQADPDMRAAEVRLQDHLGTKVRLRNRKNGAGKIEIEYYSLDELNGLLEKLGILR